MKLKIRSAKGSIICCIFLIGISIFLIGLFRNSNRVEQSTPASLEKQVEAGNAENDSDLDEQNDLIINKQDIEMVKRNGNIFEQGEYQSYGGFGYRVVDFAVYHSYEEVKQQPDYDSRNEVRQPDSTVGEFAYVKVEITNESNADAVYYNPLRMLVRQDGHLGVKTETEEWGFISGFVYIGGVTKHANEMDASIQSPFTALLSGGETITLQYYFELYAVSDDKEMALSDIYTDAEYMLQVSGAMTSGEIFDELEKDGMHIYFRVQ